MIIIIIAIVTTVVAVRSFCSLMCAQVPSIRVSLLHCGAVPVNTWGGGQFTRTANPSSRSRAGRATPDSSPCEGMMYLSPHTGVNALSPYPRPRG